MNIELLPDKECIICLDNKETEWFALECHHEYHKKCIHTWMHVRMTCPICIRIIHPIYREESYIVVHDSENNAHDEYCERQVTRAISIMAYISVACLFIGIIMVIYNS
jgi:hypothetical protein